MRVVGNDKAQLVSLSGKTVAKVGITTEVHAESVARGGRNAAPLSDSILVTTYGCGGYDWVIHIAGYKIKLVFMWC